MDYQGNAKKNKPEQKPEKKIQRVTTGETIVQKKSLGRKIKETFIEADFRSVVVYVFSDVLIPAAKNMIVDSVNQGISRAVYGENAMRRRHLGGNSRMIYNNPINRSNYPEPRTAPQVTHTPRSQQRNIREDFILASREDAELVLERMNDIIDKYDVVSVADLNGLIGWPTSYTDNNWGWSSLGDVQIRQIRDGYLIDLPPAEHIQ